MEVHEVQQWGKELYDETKNPLEWMNLAGKTEYAAVKAELAKHLPKVHKAAPSSSTRATTAGSGRLGSGPFTDEAIRTPMIVSWPSVVKAGVNTDAMVSWVDILPTLVEAGGGKSSAGDCKGGEFLGVLKGTIQEHRAEIFATHSGDGDGEQHLSDPLRSDGAV